MLILLHSPNIVKPNVYIPYAVKAKVEEIIDQLVAQGTLAPVWMSEWALPIIPIVKPENKSVHSCGDFTQTVNPVADTLY